MYSLIQFYWLNATAVVIYYTVTFLKKTLVELLLDYGSFECAVQRHVWARIAWVMIVCCQEFSGSWLFTLVFLYLASLWLLKVCKLLSQFMLLLSCRYKILCSLWAGNSVYGESFETNIWVIHRLCIEEPILWDGDANSMWVVWHKFGTSSTEGSSCLIGEMRLRHNPIPGRQTYLLKFVFSHCL